MRVTAALVPVIDRIYEAAGDASAWPRFAATLASVARVPAVALLQHGLGERIQVRMSGTHGIAPETSALYERYYGALDPWAEEMRRRGDFAPGSIVAVASEALLPWRSLVRTEYYADFGRFHGSVGHAALAMADAAGRSVIALTLARGPGSAPYGRREVAVLRALAPHLGAAARLTRILDDDTADRRTLAEVLNHRRSAVLIVSPSGRLQWANVAGERELGSGLLIGVRDGRVTARSSQEVAAFLAEAFASTGQRMPGRDLEAFVEAPDGGRRRIWAVPLLQSGDAGPRLGDVGVEQSAILLVVEPPRPTRSQLIDAMTHMLGLTPSEALVTECLMHGTSSDAARRLGLSRDAIRWHLKCAYRKTGTTHQADLVRVVLMVQQAFAVRRR